MINLALQTLAAQLNQHFRRIYDLTEDMVVVSNLMEMDGSVTPNINNRLVVYLTNIEKDSVSARTLNAQEPGERTMQRSAALSFNLFVMMTANFSGNNYAEALKFLSGTISYFQRHPVFTRQSAPDMDSRIEKLVLDIENLSIQDMSNLWGSLGGKYMPSILYRIRMVTFDADEVTGRQPIVTAPKPFVGND